jgi:ectoine hydroxylase
MHGSPDNISSQPRRLLMFVYNSCENRPVEPFGGQAPRPGYLSSRVQAPLQPADSL